jgi:hypothetical protein
MLAVPPIDDKVHVAMRYKHLVVNHITSSYDIQTIRKRDVLVARPDPGVLIRPIR